jgi:hypothetical protein
MKRTKTCPKCASRRVWRVDKYTVPADSTAGAPLRVTIERPPSRGLFARDDSTQGYIDAWVCDGCGFTELWARDIDGLKPDPGSGLVLYVDGAPAPKR